LDNYYVAVKNIEETPQGNYLLDAVFFNYLDDVYSIFYKMNMNGDLIDSIVFDNEYVNAISNFVEMEDGVYRIFQDVHEDEINYKFVLTDININMEKILEIEYSSEETAHTFSNFILLENGNTLFASSVIKPNSTFEKDLVFYLFAPNGELLKQNKIIIDTKYLLHFVLKDLQELPDNNYIGSTHLFMYGEDEFNLIKFDTNLMPIDSLHITNTFNTEWISNEGLIKSETNYYTGGFSRSPGNINKYYGLAKANLNFEAEKTIEFGYYDDSVTNVPASLNHLDYKDNSLFFLGNYDYNIFEKPRYMDIYKFDDDLEIIWHKIIGAKEDHFVPLSIKGTNDGGCIIIGQIENYENNVFDACIVKLDEDGIVNTKETFLIISDAVVFPNPGKEKLIIKSTLTETEFLLTDLQGKSILQQKITDENTEINTQNLNPGIYLWTLKKEGKMVESGKWIKE
jgi:hypothetical protein